MKEQKKAMCTYRHFTSSIVLKISDRNLRRLKQSHCVLSHIIIHQNSPLGHLHLADVHVALLGDDPLAELLVMRLEVEEVFARQLLPDHVPQPPGGPGPGAPGDGVLTGELTLRLTLQGPGHLDVLDATLAVIHRDQGRTLAEVVLVPDLEVGVEHFLRG